MQLTTDAAKRLFNQFRYEKTAGEIKVQAEKKVSALAAKIKEREGRIADLRATHDIDETAMVRLLNQARQDAQNDHRTAFTYLASNGPPGPQAASRPERTIGAGVVSHLLEELDLIEAERAAIERLEAVMRNLRPLKRHTTSNGTRYDEDAFSLSYDELQFLGF